MLLAMSCFNAAYASELSLVEAVTQAVANDNWLTSSRLRERAYRNEAISYGSLPDPTLSVGLANLPTDSWDFDQENMTQFKVGVTQRFPGGDSRAVKARKTELQADINPIQRRERKAQLTQAVSHLWLDSYLAKRSIQLIENDRGLFEQLVDMTTARYKSTVGKIRQQDVIRAQLELTKLDDRLTRLRLRYDISRQLLAEWLPIEFQSRSLLLVLPNIPALSSFSTELVQTYIKRHPQLLIADKKIDIQHAEVELINQTYKPGWALNASYGYREDSPMGVDRSDFFSIGVTFDLPVFTENRQNRGVAAARYRQQALSVDYQLLERKLLSKAYKAQAEIDRLEERSSLYKTRLLKQTHDQLEASLSAYTNNDGDFSDVMRAYIAELNSKVESLEIKVNHRKALATMNYLMMGIHLSGAKVAQQGEWK
ncbi:MAG: outer membrane protein TolC [Pseudohongiellaceae bacterium]|jgi:outer membrane protein TolC